MGEQTAIKINWTDKETVQISGIIDEFASIKNLFEGKEGSIKVDFSGISRINSSGVREWVQAALASKARLHLINCDPVIIDQVSMIPQFLGNGGVVESFYAHYACPSCGHEETSLIVLQEDASIETVKNSIVECSKCKADMELDHTPEVFLAFLSR